MKRQIQITSEGIVTTETEKYITVFKRLQYATHVVRRDTGEEIKNRIEVASFYGYMRDQYTSYSAKDLEFFESMESMGLKFQNTDRRTVKKWLDVLNAIGLVISDKRGKDERGYDRYYHTVIPLEEIADNLLFYGSASISGGLLAEGMLIRSLEKKKPRGKPKQKSGDKQGDGNCHKEGAEAAKTQAATADQSVNLAPEPALDDSEQRSGVESDTERGSDVGTDGNHAESQEVQEDDPTFPPKKPASDYAPWQGMAFEGGGRLSEAAYKWALTAGATDWRHACRMVWEKVGVTPPDEINEDRKPKFLMQSTNDE
ncbi:DUF6945 domain-containing protein [Klebsiella michiganensis]|uniref:DUF6945 domain-containing protein n=1 Tax=Klebsiella michiganensis TaxID=1134687 RepID=UPI002A4AC553|nr:hypothetical protein [Raoultella ornithinolytica]